MNEKMGDETPRSVIRVLLSDIRYVGAVLHQGGRCYEEKLDVSTSNITRVSFVEF